MRNLNDKYEGAGGQSLSNPIYGFTEGRRKNDGSMFGKVFTRFGTFIKDAFAQNLEISYYSKALLELI
jgi:hypothetical protein